MDKAEFRKILKKVVLKLKNFDTKYFIVYNKIYVNYN